MFTLCRMACIQAVNQASTLVEFYRALGCTLVKELAIIEKNMTLYYLAYDEPESLHCGRHWTDRSGVLELSHIHGSERNTKFSVTNGNTEPHLGFGYIAISVDNLKAVRQRLEKGGFLFAKQLTDTGSEDTVFIIDPDGYWVRFIERCLTNQDVKIGETTSSTSNRLSHTMIRVKDPSVSLKFYQDVLGMSLLHTSSPAQMSPDSTSYYLGYIPKSSQLLLPLSSTAELEGVVELVWKRGTEKQQGRAYHDGNSAPEGFGHLCRFNSVRLPEMSQTC